MKKKILTILIIVLVLIQFFRPAKNISIAKSTTDISNIYQMPNDVSLILDKACNDCHSNNTAYPWYSKIQPVDWWLDNHVQEGKRELNLDEYTNRRLRYQYHKMEEIADQVKKGEMPLNSYTWIHKDAILTEAEKTALIGWADGVREQMKAKYPLDSLIRKKTQ